MDLKGEPLRVKRRDGHYRDSCEGHKRVRLVHTLCLGGRGQGERKVGRIGEQVGVKELLREETLRGVTRWRGGETGERLDWGR